MKLLGVLHIQRGLCKAPRGFNTGFAIGTSLQGCTIGLHKTSRASLQVFAKPLGPLIWWLCCMALLDSFPMGLCYDASQHLQGFATGASLWFFDIGICYGNFASGLHYGHQYSGFTTGLCYGTSL